MGTTDDALQTGSGQFGFALAVEGFEYLLTDAADPAAVVTAWTGTEWSAAIPGLKVIGTIKRSIEPFKPDLDIPTLTFQIMDTDGSDLFGKAVFKTKPSILTHLDAAFEPADDGSGTVTVKSNAGFPSSGSLYIGTRRIAYASKSGGTDLVVAAGGASTYSPFLTHGGDVVSRPAHPAQGKNFDVAAPPKVTDVPQHWVGKRVALYMHRIVGGVWDVKNEASLRFAGSIAEVKDDGGVTILVCQDLARQIEDTVLCQNQWVGYIKSGIQLVTGQKFRATEHFVSTGRTVSAECVVVASGASGVDEINAGLYELNDFYNLLEAWLDNTMGGEWAFGVWPGEEGRRTRISSRFSGNAKRWITFQTKHRRVLEFMGFTKYREFEDSWIGVASDDDYDDVHVIWSDSAPYRVRALQRYRTGSGTTIDCDDSDGTWFNHASHLPKAFQGTTDLENWSYVIIGGKQLAVAEYSSATKLVNVIPVAGYGEPYHADAEIAPPGLTLDDPPDRRLEVRQIVYLSGKFSTLIPKLFATIPRGTAGVNHATYDTFNALGGAAIPWSLLGDTFVNSCKSLETEHVTDTMAIRMDRPTRLRDLLIPELALRFAFLIFKDGVYQFTTLVTPDSSQADHTLDETNKAVGSGEQVPLTNVQVTSDYLTNVVKLNWERDTSGRYRRFDTVMDSVSISLFGESAALTIDCVNSVADLSSSNVASLGAVLATKVFAMFGRPARLITRTIAPSLYHMAPGDTVALSDDYMRDPTTGARGVTSRACTVLSVVHDYGHEGGRLMGEVTLLYTDEERAFRMSSAAEVDTSHTAGDFTDGYDATNFRLKLKEHAFSRASQVSDVSKWADGDLVRIVELDPADPSSPDAWSRTIDSSGVDVANGWVQLTSGLSSPAFDGSTKRYVLIPQSYTDVQASQKLRAFQADEGDGLIEDTIEPNAYATESVLEFDSGAATELPALLAEELAGDGKPLTPFQCQYLTRGVNNLINYKTANHCPIMNLGDSGGILYSTPNADYTLVAILPFYVGGYETAGRERLIYVGPQFRSATDGVTAYIRITSLQKPPKVNSGTDYSFSTPHRSVTFSTSVGTAMQQPTPVTLLPAVGANGLTWICVELKGSGGSRSYGLTTLYLGPIT